ncbi:MAG: metal-dependent hydrolase [Gammaproteobacteria bacterium]|nr:metal-dependent hydrolase [Gammaproteobacteria bacterium]
MDLLTQSLLGSAMAQSAAAPEKIRQAAIIGLLAGLSADLDILIRSSQDPLLNLEFHRHFTHSVFFIPIAALLLSALFWPLFRKHLSWPQILLFSLLGFSLSGFIDACTSYGTSLLWPLSDERISFNIIAIVDPVFTLLLVVGISISLKRRNHQYARVFLLLAASYLLLGLLQNHRVQTLTEQYAMQQGHAPEQLLVKPTLGNLLLWRSIYLHQGEYHINAFRLNPVTGDGNVIPGETIAQFKPWDHELPIDMDSKIQSDIDRFAFFSDNYLALHPKLPDRIIDVRFANLPHRVFPLWGIHYDLSQPQQHVSYEFYRSSDKLTRQTFMHMLLTGSTDVSDRTD